MNDIKTKNLGVAGNNARISDGQHFHEHHHYTSKFPDSIPLQRPPKVDHFTNRKAELACLLNDLKPGKVIHG